MRIMLPSGSSTMAAYRSGGLGRGVAAAVPLAHHLLVFGIDGVVVRRNNSSTLGVSLTTRPTMLSQVTQNSLGRLIEGAGYCAPVSPASLCFRDSDRVDSEPSASREGMSELPVRFGVCGQAPEE